MGEGGFKGGGGKTLIGDDVMSVRQVYNWPSFIISILLIVQLKLFPTI